MTSIDKNILVGKYQRADENNRLLSAYRPLPPETLKSLREYYRVGLTYTSNAIEGNSLTESETKVVIEDGLTIEGKPLRDIYEAVGHAKAYDFLHEITEKKQLEEEDILTLHRIFYQQIDPEKAGVYRNVKVFISGSRYAVSPVARIAEDMRKLVNWYNRNEKKLHPIELAAELHLRFVFIRNFCGIIRLLNRRLFRNRLGERGDAGIRQQSRRRRKQRDSFSYSFSEHILPPCIGGLRLRNPVFAYILLVAICFISGFSGRFDGSSKRLRFLPLI